MSRLADPELVALWRERLQRFGQSQLTVAEFCEVESVSTASFYQWRRKLERSQSPQREAGAFEAGAFIAVELRSTSQAARLSLPGGATLELPEELKPAHLRELIAAVVDVTSPAASSAEDA